MEQCTAFSTDSVQHWVWEVSGRAAEITIGLLGVLYRLDPHASVAESGPTIWERLSVMFGVCDAVASLLERRHGWRDISRLAVARVFRPPGVTPLPVWA